MKKYLKVAVMAAVLSSGTHAALAADVTSENRAIDARAVDIALDGVISLKVKQGPVAALTIYGEPEQIQKVVVEQSGETLHISTKKMNGMHFGNKRELRAELTLPNVRSLTSGGVGTTEMAGFSGDSLRLALDGAGSVKVDGQYRNMDVRLGGVGGMTVKNGSSDNVDLHLNGAGQIEISGQTKQLHATLGGVGSLEAQHLHADAIDVNMTGLGSASLYAKTSADLNLTGMGSATVYGNPANRHASAHGMGSVSWH